MLFFDEKPKDISGFLYVLQLAFCPVCGVLTRGYGVFFLYPNPTFMFNPFEELQARLIRLEALVCELHAASPVTLPHTQTIGGIELAMQITGLAKSTIYNLVSDGRIPHMKRGKKLYFSRMELESWIADGKQKTLQELEAEVDSYLTHPPKKRH